ncbi:hypothetical protein TRIUR3_16511 [Triticum urartu]|uniref:PIR2-like helical domain-containing protein n=1 Tax=Triticum urartu TaxID=4572 RepID=M7ZIJ3_TRIUA|nr:hypothetical protein TRIUR3_16511 [Triticum urartu]
MAAGVASQLPSSSPRAASQHPRWPSALHLNFRRRHHALPRSFHRSIVGAAMVTTTNGRHGHCNSGDGCLEAAMEQSWPCNVASPELHWSLAGCTRAALEPRRMHPCCIGASPDAPVLHWSLAGVAMELRWSCNGASLDPSDLNLVHRCTHARGVLVAGHCYGPLSPVDNILVNAIWYDTAFPRRPTVDFHFGDVLEISPECIARIAHRSLEGLIACLLHLCPSLSRDDALWHLHLSKADLSRAIASASDSVSAPTQAAFLKAAEAAHHPMPHALALFVSSVFPKVERDARMLLCVNRALTAPELDRLSDMLVPSPLPEDLYPPPPLVGVELVLPNIKSSTTLLTKNTMVDWMTMTKRLGMEMITGIINFLSL